MKIKRIGVAAAALAATAALALTGCSNSGSGGDDNSEVKKDVSITVAQNQPFVSYNSGSANGNSTYNSNITYMTTSSFNYYNNKSQLVKNTKFGTYKVESQDPLTIKYTVNKGVKWSDGDQVGAADLLLDWAVGQSKYNNEKGVNFSSATAGLLDLVSEVPTVGDDGRSVTIKYDKPYVDWETNFGVGPVAAHAAYEQAFPGTKPADADKAVIKAIQDNDTATLTKLAKSWSTAFDFPGDLPSDKSLYLSDGPFIIQSLKKDQYVTLVKNKDYNWGPKPKASKITVRFITDPTAQVQALQNGEIDITYSQADQDTVAALKKLSGVTTSVNSASTYEHIDLTMDNKGPFDPATYGGDAAKALAARKAFLMTIPRQQIIDNLIKPIQSDAKLDDSLTYLPGFDGYDESVAQNGMKAYDKVDIAGAKAELAKAGVSGFKVRFLYAKSNPRRAAEFALIKASAAKAGITVVDDGNDDWSEILGNGSYDASLFAWSFSSTAVTGGEQLFESTGGGNYSGYKSATVDKLYSELDGTFDKSKQQEILQQIDKQLVSDGFGTTLFQFPDVTAWNNNVKGVKYAPLTPNVFWNFWDWTK
ncbi:ABC transporter family substrate-binding protein [Gryllotalpicola ginsengisoli]|uniref:ABC transporter family substrate-binding protein n=1 Tax=Gryllotalpicola ginsengisoli TaxID=444608 RepID=UPI0003B67590|nr:ABC transporter family substrate-binding protein [Gryllotalpicola ginsengisoli]